jgi:hypothetical protein
MIDLVLELSISEKQFEYVLDLGLLPGQILNDPLHRNLPPPNLLPLEAIVQEDGVALLAGFGEVLLLGLGLKASALDHLLDVPRRAVVVDHVVDDGEQLLERLPVAESDRCYYQV